MHVPFITPTLSHPFITYPFWNTSAFFHADYLEVFHLNAYDTNLMKGTKQDVLAYFIKTNNKKMSCEQSSDVIFNINVYNLYKICVGLF